MTDWIPFSRPNWLPIDKDAGHVQIRGYNNPGEGPRVVGDLQAALAQFWGVPAEWILLTSSCTEAIQLWSMWCARDAGAPLTWEVPALTWPGSYCGVHRNLPHMFADLLWEDDPHPNMQTATQIRVRLYGEDLDLDGAGKYSLLDCAHDVEFMPDFGPFQAAAYSFGPCKQLSAERGGALVSPQCANGELRLMANSGVDGGRVPRMDTALKCGMYPSAAGMILSQLGRFPSDQIIRTRIIEWYRRVFENTTDVKVFGDSGHLAVLYFSDTRMLHTFSERLFCQHVRTGHHYRPPRGVDCPNARSFASRILTVPCFARWKGTEELSHMQGAILRAREEVGLPRSGPGELRLD